MMAFFMEVPATPSKGTTISAREAEGQRSLEAIKKGPPLPALVATDSPASAIGPSVPSVRCEAPSKPRSTVLGGVSTRDCELRDPSRLPYIAIQGPRFP